MFEGQTRAEDARPADPRRAGPPTVEAARPRGPDRRPVRRPPTLSTTAVASLQPQLAAIAATVEGPAWLVGGVVRDALLGRPLRDLDVVVPSGSVAAARRLADRLGGAVVPVGAAHGVGRVVLSGPRRTVIDLADFRRPDLDADLAARDVTVDALAVSLEALLAGLASIHDPTGGLGDLAARRLRACGASSFVDDPVRVLRLIRLAHELAFTVEVETERWARAAARRLHDVAAERVRDELTRILALPRAAPALRVADDWGVLDVLLPEAAAMRAATQSPPHRFTVWEHSLRAVEAADALLGELDLLAPHTARVAALLAEPLGDALRRQEVLRMAALLHDIAKPETRSVDPDGRLRFTGHDRVGAQRAIDVATRLRWPGRAVGVLERLVRQHLRPMHLGALAEITPRARYRFFRDLGEEAPLLVCLTIVDAAATDGRPPAAVYRGPTRVLLDSLLAGQVEAARAAASPPLVRGEDVMGAFGLAPGPEVGRLLAAAREAQALGLVRTREETLAWLARRPLETEPESG